MIDVEPVIQEELERLAPHGETEQPDWGDVLRRLEPGPIPRPEPHRPRSWLRARSAAAVAAVAGTMVMVMLIAPWDSGPSLFDRALAAVGDQPVLHVVITRPAHPAAPVSIDSGQPIERAELTEIWFDRSRDLKKTVSTLDGRVLDEMLETATGGFTRGGPIYTCAWIAAHPVEATKAGVSCNASGDNGTTPRHIPEQPPTIDETLAGFVDRYESALAAGRAREIGDGKFEGRDVVWLEIPATGAGTPRYTPTARVAIDAGTFKPLLVEAANGATSFRVLTIETVAFSQTLFTKPELIQSSPGGVGGSVRSSTEISPGQTPAALGGTALWLGEEWRGYRLVETTRAELSIGYGARSEREPTRTTGIEFTYARLGTDGTVDPSSTFRLAETTICTIFWGWSCSPRDPSEGTMLTLGPRSLVLDRGLYVTIWNWNQLAQPAPLDIARALRPVTNG